MSNEEAHNSMEIGDRAPQSLLPRRRMDNDLEMDITPMIDITFLLLIFFLVASKMDPSNGVSLPKARHGTAVTSRDSAILTIAQGEGDEVLIYKGDGQVADTLLTATSPRGQEQEIIAYLTEQFNSSPPKIQVVIKAAKIVKHRETSRVARAVGMAKKDVPLFVAVMEVQ